MLKHAEKAPQDIQYAIQLASLLLAEEKKVAKIADQDLRTIETILGGKTLDQEKAQQILQLYQGLLEQD